MNLLDVNNDDESTPNTISIRVDEPRISSPGSQRPSSLEILMAQTIIHKQNRKDIEDSWTTKQEDLLYTWSEKAAGYRWIHIRTHEYYTLMNNLYTYPIVIFSTVIGFCGMVMNKPHLSEVDVNIMYLLSSCNLVVAMLSTLHKFNKCAEKAEHHLFQSVQYAKFYREINMELSLERRDRENGIAYCKSSKYNYDNLLSTSMNVPRKIIREFNSLFPNVMNRPDIANGLFDMNVKRRVNNGLQYMSSNSFVLQSLRK
jgi:hypothetical protein